MDATDESVRFNTISDTKVPYSRINEMIDRYRREHGVYVPPKEMQAILRQVDLTGLELILKKKLMLKKQNEAAAKIQAWFRGYLVRQWYSKVHAIRTIAACRIQLAWKIIYLAKIKPNKLITMHLDKVKFV